MRLAWLALLLSACVGSASELSLSDDDADPNSPGGLPPPECAVADDCVLAGATCCDCPTFALPVDDPRAQACITVDCNNEGQTCATNVEPACVSGTCQLACAPLECLPCPNGYIAEANGCLSCTCAEPPPTDPTCTVDADCVRTRADCCGCDAGGEDTAVAAADVAAFDQSLMCPVEAQCPGLGNALEATCGADYEPRCSTGSCALLLAMPVEVCGRPDLPACPSGQVCLINVDPAASQYGLGVCQ